MFLYFCGKTGCKILNELDLLNMRKRVFFFMATLLLCSCTRDIEAFDDVYVKLTNLTGYTLNFSEIKCRKGPDAQDLRFYPVRSFSLAPKEAYTQMQRHIEAHEGIIIAPTSMVLECGGRSIQIDSDHDLYRNPCRFENWHHFHTKGKNQAGEHWEFDITNDDIDKWFDK